MNVWKSNLMLKMTKWQLMQLKNWITSKCKSISNEIYILDCSICSIGNAFEWARMYYNEWARMYYNYVISSEIRCIFFSYWSIIANNFDQIIDRLYLHATIQVNFSSMQTVFHLKCMQENECILKSESIKICRWILHENNYSFQ